MKLYQFFLGGRHQCDDFDRNFLRNQILPQLKNRWPALDKTVSRSARLCATSQELLNGRVQQFNKSINLQADCVFFDRGIPDIIAYLNFKKADLSKKILKAVDKYRYDMIFLLEPWEDIYSSDIIRYESFDQVITIDRYIKNTYKEFGYNLIIVPKDNIKNRVDFVINTLK